MSTPRTLRLPPGVRRVTIETSRGSFAALEAVPAAGACERQPALLIPGYTGSKEDFIAVLSPLAAAGRRVAAFDMRGQYESPPAAGAEGYTLAALAADVALAAGWLGSGEPAPGGQRGFHLLGHSFGGLVARELALTGAARISSLTLMSSGPGTLTGTRAETLSWVLAGLRGIAAGDLPGEIRRLWESYLEPEAVAGHVPRDIIEFLRSRMLGSCPLGLRAMAEILLNCPDRTEALARQRPAPVLVIYGEDDDAWSPGIQEAMARRLGAERVCVPGAAHSPAVEAPETVASSLTAFWNATETREGRALRTGTRAAR